MAKRKAARAAKKTAARAAKPAGRKTPARKAARPARTGRSAAKKAKKSAAVRSKPARKPRVAAKKATKKVATRTAAKPAARKAAKQPARKTAAKAPAAARKAAARKAPAPVPVRKAPALNRQRRILDEDIVRATPPSSLDMNRSASAVRSGRRELKERYAEHTETSPALTGGDVDADWESAYSVGDEAPGGDNPTPDQDIVDDIGRAVGIEYQDNEELKGADKVEKRDRNRWELDPASSDDWDERD
jgi:hypothetical protein